MRNLVLVFACVITFAGFAIAAHAEDEWEARTYKDANGKTLPYRLLKPIDYDPKQDKKYPLVLFFHGVGESGHDNQAQLKNGVRAFAKEDIRKKFPCFVAAPQCEKGLMWVNTPWSLDSHIQPETPSEPMRRAMEMRESLLKEMPIDPNRQYMTGLSFGGFGVWDAITRYPDVFAAAIPVCGGADEHKASLVAKLPIWAFHGDKDGVVKTIRSRHIIEAIKKEGGNPKYTEYPGVGHDSWTRAFNEPELMPWLFQQHK